MSDRSPRDTSLTQDLEDQLLDDFDVEELLEAELNGEEDRADGEPASSVVATPAPRPVPTLPAADAVDGLAEPQTRPDAAGPASGTPRDLRERIRSSRYGTLVVLLVTAVLVAAGMWFVDGRGPGGETLPNGATAVSIPGKSTVPPPKVGSPAQDFTVTTIDGEQVSLSQYKGKAVWVVFGASWCAPCQAEVPDIEAAYQKYGPQGLEILGVNITEDTPTVREYVQRVKITFPVAADPESAVADAYRVTAIPAHFFIDKDGVLKQIWQGSVSETSIEASMKGLVTP
ncbi:MAG: TlpA family protein disulfide reductase [Dietzia sp.]|nr:TlpA family protein disulfide reductase [Dietzia sp.]